jgi:hypothetical protein
MKKKSFPPETSKEKKQSTLSACLGLPIGWMKFVFPKEFVTIFGLGYYPLQRTPYLLNPRNVKFGLRDPDLVMRWEISNVYSLVASKRSFG